MHKGAGASGGMSGSRAQHDQPPVGKPERPCHVYLHQTRLSDVIRNDLTPMPRCADPLYRGGWGLMGRVYLDHNATMPLRPEARDAMIAAVDVAGKPLIRASRGSAQQSADGARAARSRRPSARGRRILSLSLGRPAAALALSGRGLKGARSNMRPCVHGSLTSCPWMGRAMSPSQTHKTPHCNWPILRRDHPRPARGFGSCLGLDPRLWQIALGL